MFLSVLSVVLCVALVQAGGDRAFEFAALRDGDVVSCYDELDVTFANGERPRAQGVLRVVSDDIGARLFRGLTTVDYPLIDRVPAADYKDGKYVVPDFGDNDEGIVLRYWSDAASVNDAKNNADTHVHLLYICTDAIREAKGDGPAVREEKCEAARADLATVDADDHTALAQSGALGSECRSEAADGALGCRCLAALMAKFWAVENRFTAYHCFSGMGGGENKLTLGKRVRALHEQVLAQRCVAAPCGSGGFCSTSDMCSGDGYQWTPARSSLSRHPLLAEQSCLGENAGCCEPACAVLLDNGNVQPGSCQSEEQQSEIEARGQKCWKTFDWGAAKADSNTCERGENRCCSAVPCSTGPTGALDGVCMSRAACDAQEADAVSGAERCTDAEVCCAVGLDNARSLELDNDVNKDSANLKAAFRENKDASLKSSASSLSASSLAAIALVSLL